MTIKNLECFLLVAELRSFSKAAGKLFLTPPAVTQQINALECELGFKLFERGNKGAAPTPAGEAFSRDAGAILASLNDAIAHARVIAGVDSQRLRIGVWGGSGCILIPAICRAFSEARPNVKLEFVNTDGNQYERLLRDRAIDLDITFGVTGQEIAGLRVLTLYHERPMCMIPRQSELAEKDKVRFSDLRGRSLVIPLPGRSLFHDKLRKYVQENESEIRVFDVYENETGLIQMQVMEAVALCPPSIAECGSGFVLRPFEWDEVTSIDMVTRDEKDALLTAFFNVARKSLRELGYA